VGVAGDARRPGRLVGEAAAAHARTSASRCRRT
jgi:hypothetical protein